MDRLSQAYHQLISFFAFSWGGLWPGLLIGIPLGVLFISPIIRKRTWQWVFPLYTSITHFMVPWTVIVLIPLFVAFLSVYSIYGFNDAAQRIMGLLLNDYPHLTFMLFGIIITSVTLPMIIKPDLIYLQYFKWGRLQFWGEATKTFNENKKWQSRFFSNCMFLINRNRALQGKELVIVGPAAMHGEYESELGEIAKKSLSIDVRVFASDRVKTKHKGDYTMDGYSYQYIEEIDARNLTHVLPAKANVILDIKGALWHIPHEAPFGFGKKDRIEQIMMTYYELLAPGGCILIDGYANVSSLSIAFNAMQLQLRRKITGYAENSTYSIISSSFHKSELLQSHFKEIRIEDGIYSAVCYERISEEAAGIIRKESA